MKQARFVTPTWHGRIELSDQIIKMYNEWVKFERELDPDGAVESTTQNGWQYIFKYGEPEPDWLGLLHPEINKIKEEIKFARLKNIWAVEYDNGGYQDPHFHNVGIAKVVTTIINLQGTGEIILQEPRQLAMAQGINFAETITLKPGEWMSMPAYLIHNSKPCKGQRSILVIDSYVNDPL